MRLSGDHCSLTGNTMNASPYWPASAIFLGVFGFALIAMGLYFILIRPPLLPEDLRYIGMGAEQAQAAAPGLAAWLGHVFRVMGGHIIAAGILTVTLAATSFRRRKKGAALAAGFSGLASIGLMVATNFLIDSDFKWLLLGIAALWGLAMLRLAIEQPGEGGLPPDSGACCRRRHSPELAG
jgi:hypothetical protein